MVLDPFMSSLASALLANLATEFIKKVAAGEAVSDESSSTGAGLKFAIFRDTDGLSQGISKLLKLRDVLSGFQTKNDLVLSWLGKIDNAAIIAVNLVDEIIDGRVQKQQMDTITRLRNVPKRVTSRIHCAHKISEFMSMVSEIYEEIYEWLKLLKLKEGANRLMNM